MKSTVYRLANQQGFNNIQQFALQARLTWPVAKGIWEGDISKVTLQTLVKAAVTLGCKVDDLFETEAS